MTSIAAWGAISSDTEIAPLTIERRAVRPDDVDIQILYCGVCHTDLHNARNDWGRTKYPLIPGHEIIGRVRAVGSDVLVYKVGDVVAVGNMVDSCRECEQCYAHQEHHCEKFPTATYGGVDRRDGSPTYGGYSAGIIVRQEFVFHLPAGLDPARAAPLLCAGVTTYSPLKHWNVGPGSRVGVVGLGGLGHMAVKLAVGLGAHVTLITTSPSKVADAATLGAHDVLLSTDADAMREAASRFNFILDTIPVAHDVQPYLQLLKPEGTHVMVGAPETFPSINALFLMFGRKSLAGSIIGGIKETQEMLDFCAEKNIQPDIEIISMADINNAFTRMEKSDVKYRFVIDMGTL